MSVTTLFIIAVFLLVAEALIFSMGVLGFIAFLAFSYGLFTMHETGMTDFHGIEFEFVAAIGFSIFVIFAVGGYFAYRSFNKKISVGLESMIGSKATIKQWADQKGQIIYEGEMWRATSTDTFEPNDTCIITDYNNMTLTIKKDT